MARDYNRNNRQNENENYNDVTNRIKSLNQLSDLSIKDIADEGGYADKVAKGSKQLKTNQLRKFFGAVRLIEQKTTWDEIEPEFYLLKPKLAVAVGRGNVPKAFYNFMMAAMSKVDVGSEEDKFCQKCGAKINGKSDNDDWLSFNKTNLYPIILGFIFLLIAILFASRLVLVLCLFAAGFLFEFKSDNAFLNSILVAVIPGILFIITMQNIYYLLMCFIPPIAGCFIAATYRRR